MARERQARLHVCLYKHSALEERRPRRRSDNPFLIEIESPPNPFKLLYSTSKYHKSPHSTNFTHESLAMYTHFSSVLFLLAIATSTHAYRCQLSSPQNLTVCCANAFYYYGDTTSPLTYATNCNLATMDSSNVFACGNSTSPGSYDVPACCAKVSFI